MQIKLLQPNWKNVHQVVIAFFCAFAGHYYCYCCRCRCRCCLVLLWWKPWYWCVGRSCAWGLPNYFRCSERNNFHCVLFSFWIFYFAFLSYIFVYFLSVYLSGGFVRMSFQRNVYFLYYFADQFFIFFTTSDQFTTQNCLLQTQLKSRIQFFGLFRVKLWTNNWLCCVWSTDLYAKIRFH